MILGADEQATAGNRTTLDDLFRRAGVRRPDALALIDPGNREAFTDGAPRKLTYADADRAISALAARLLKLGLQTDTVVGLQLANTVESVIALIGVLRAGMIAAPLPLLWRRNEMVEALGRVGAKAILTSARIDIGGQSTPFAEIAMQAAAALFPIRHVCAFGDNLPDGVVPLDVIFAQRAADFAPPLPRPGNAAAHVAIVTFDVGSDGLIAVARNHMQAIAGGLGTYLECGAAPDGHILSALPLGSFAGIALSVVPWLLSGGTLSLHHAFDPDTFPAQCRAGTGCTVVLPAPAVAALVEAGHLDDASQTIVALWRAPERLAHAAAWQGKPPLVDIASFGEAGLIARRRGPDGLALPLPCGMIAAPYGAAGAAPVIETARTTAGTLALRGPMVQAEAFPLGATPHYAVDEAGFVDTAFGCRRDRDDNTLTVTGAPGDISAIGGYRLRQRAVEAAVAEADPAATIVALPDAFLGARLAGSAAASAQIQGKLQANGLNPLIAGAFRARKPARQDAA
jgi:non-ribosomal peptide synthetase component E (peptide arylation enzyme)